MTISASLIGHNNPPEPIKWNELPAQKLYEPDTIEKVLAQIEADILADFTPDTTTKKGRDEIASRAYSVARAKTFLDDKGKELTEDYKKITKEIDQKRKSIRDRLDSLRDRTRAPLDAWQQADEARQQRHRDTFARVQAMAHFPVDTTVQMVDDRIDDLAVIAASYDWEEFADHGVPEVKRIETLLAEKRAAVVKADAERAELERLRAEAEARRQQEEAERKAKEEADRQAQAEKEQQEREARIARETQEKAEREAKEREAALQREKDEAEARARKAEEDRIAAEARSKAEAEAAALRERERIAAEKKAEEDAQARREANKRHVAKVNTAAITALSVAVPDLEMEFCRKVIEAIAAGKVTNVNINY